MLEARNLECVYGYDTLFSGYNLSLAAGQIVQITGGNGVGKTSLLRILSGLSRPETGEVRWQGESIFTAPQNYRQQLAYLGHLNALKPALTALENLTLQQSLRPQASRIGAKQALEEVGLGGYQATLSQQLSAGENRRLALARLWLTKAKLWILDEPISAIDAAGVAVFIRLVRQHIARQGMVIITSHQRLDFAPLDYSESPIVAR